MSKRFLGTVGAAALTAGFIVAGVVPAGAQAGEAMIRVAHFSPDAPNVDVYVNGDKTLSDVAFKAVSDYLEVPAGTYELAVRPAGAAADSDPVIEADASLEAGRAYTVAAVGALADITPAVFVDDLAAPAAGQAKIRVIHAAPEVPAVDVGVAGQTPEEALVKNLSFPDASSYLEVPAGSYDLEVRPAGTSDVALPVNGLALEAGKVYTAAAVGSGSDVTVLPIVDAAGMAAPAPSGGVATGLGGTADQTSEGSSALVFLLAGAAAVAVIAGGAFAALRPARVRGR